MTSSASGSGSRGSQQLPPGSLAERASVVLPRIEHEMLEPLEFPAEELAQEFDDGEESPTESEKAYVIAEQERVRTQKILIEDHKKYNANYQYNGLFIDFLVRCRSNPRTAMQSKLLLDPDPKDDIIRDGEGIVKMEKLLARIKRRITYYYKSENAPQFREHKDLKTHFWEIVEYKRHAFALSVDVENWKLRDLLRQARGRVKSECPKERQGRLGEFWSKYHNSHKTIDLRLAATGSGHLKLGTGYGGNFWPGKDDETSPAAAKIDAWKMRASRNKRAHPASKAGDDDQDGEVEEAPVEARRRGVQEILHGRLVLGHGPRPVKVAIRPQAQTTSSATLIRKLREKEALAPAVVPRSVKKALGDASLALLNPPAPAGFRSTMGNTGFGKTFNVSMGKSKNLSMSMTLGKSSSPMGTMGKIMSSSTPNLPSMLDQSGSPPQERKMFGLPHSKTGGGKESERNSPTNIYLRSCDENFVLPTLLPFCTGDSDKLSAAGQGLSDHNLCAVTEMLGNVPSIKEVDLEGNASLTERSLVPLLQHLFGDCAKPLVKFSLKKCLRNATGPGIRDVMFNVTHLLNNAAKKLQILDVGGIMIGLNSQLPLCEAISNHTALQVVGLSDVGLGRNPKVMQCLSAILDSSTILDLDVGWNNFSKDMFQHLGQKLVKAGIIKTLHVSNCAAASKNNNNPVEYFLESLSTPGSLTKLDVSMNRIDFRGALVLEASLEKNMVLCELDISNNPLACLGFRSLLRLLVRETSGLLYFNCANCHSGSLQQAADEGFQIFNSSNPGHRYILDLARPYNRALLTMLYKTCERFKLELSTSFSHIATLSPPNFTHSTQDAFGVWQLPKQGKVDLTFSVESHIENSLKGIGDGDFSGFLANHYAAMKLSPPHSKTIPLFAQWKSIDGLMIDQICMLDAMSKDFIFKYSHFDQLCRSRSVIDEIAWRLLPTVAGGDTTIFLSMLHMPTLGVYLKLYRHAVRLLHFNVDNPTGRYDLDLANCCDYAIAERLVLLDRWEDCVGRRHNLEDVSQRGVRCQVRNELYQGKPLFGVSCISEFNMPEYGALEFDYISSKRPVKDAMPIGRKTWDHILISMQRAECTALNSVEAMTMCSHYFYINSLQMRALTGIFEDTFIRCELLVRLFNRLTDMHNEKIFRSRFGEQVEFSRLQNRLGHTTFFPFIQPEQAFFELNLSVHDQRLALHILFEIRNKEALDNLRDYSLTLADGTLDHFDAGIPRSWDVYERIPDTGIFRAHYNSAPEDRNYALRRQLLRRYGYWDAPEDEKDVMWWSSIAECPVDVVEFVEFINTKYGNCHKVFKLIDGHDGNGQITLREFEEGIEKLGCKKFNGKDKSERIKVVFRYLDPSGEGQVSEGEWGVLEQLLGEIQLSVKEFVAFCERNYGDDLMVAWVEIDADGSETIDPEEWTQACRNLGFFGSYMQIFNFLDTDDEGTISLSEFKKLEEIQTRVRKQTQLEDSPTSPGGE